MNLFKSSLLSLFLSITFILPSTTFAVAVAPNTKPATDAPTKTTTEPTQTLVATVNIEDARIMSQKGNVFNIAFTLSNREGLQTGVKYGVQLVADGAKYLSDEKVYDESITLNENSKEKREIVYTAPSYLSGNYTLYLSSSNESSFPFGMATLGKVKLTPTTKTLQISNDSCYLQVVGEKALTHYTLVQSIDISQNESLSMTCTAVNNTAGAVSVTPYFESRYFSSFGKVAPQSGGSYEAISFAKGEKKSFTITLPRGNVPQFYNLKVVLMNNTLASNPVTAHYIVRGTNASIQKLSLDKNYYERGDKGELALIWQASAGNFTRSGVKTVTVPVINMKAVITNKSGKECASPIEQVLVRDFRNPQTKIAFDIKSQCIDPKVSTTLTDEAGNVLDQKDFAFQSTGDHEAKPMTTKSIIIIVVVLLAVLGLGVYMKKKGLNNQG